MRSISKSSIGMSLGGYGGNGVHNEGTKITETNEVFLDEKPT
jgi:hypothetical protein